jgi:hypothetical protein
MAPVLFGFVGGFVAALLSYKHEWPGITVLVFTGLGFAAAYGLGVMLTLSALS